MEWEEGEDLECPALPAAAKASQRPFEASSLSTYLTKEERKAWERGPERQNSCGQARRLLGLPESQYRARGSVTALGTEVKGTRGPLSGVRKVGCREARLLGPHLPLLAAHGRSRTCTFLSWPQFLCLSRVPGYFQSEGTRDHSLGGKLENYISFSQKAQGITGNFGKCKSDPITGC